MSHFEELNVLNPNVNPAIQALSGHTEIATPHKVTVLILIQQYLNAKRFNIDCGVEFPIESRRNFCMLLLKLTQYPDMVYSDLYNLITSPRYQIDSQHYEAFDKSMSEICSLGIDVLTELADSQNVQKMLTEHLSINQFSIVGVYVRRVGSSLSSMTFPEMLTLHKCICMYYEKGIRTLTIGPTRILSDGMMFQTQKSPGFADGGDTIEEFFFDRDIWHSDRIPHSKWSTKQAEIFVTEQCKLLENNELRALPPIELHSKLSEITEDIPLNARTYFCSYMNQLRLRDYYGAMYSLHRAFDRSPMQMTRQFEFKGFQYFSVNLAVMQAAFNHYHESSNALRESIMLAQDCGDKRCLDLANSWYCVLNAKQHKPQKLEIHNRKLFELNDPYILQTIATSIHFMVKHGALLGAPPLQLFSLLLKNDELVQKLETPLEFQVESLALRAGMWNLYGFFEISSLCCQLLMNLKKTFSFADAGNVESIAKVLSMLSLHLSNKGDYQLSAVVLDHAHKRFLRFPTSESWMISEYHVMIQQAIYRSQWQEALHGCSELWLVDKNAGELQHAAVLLAKRHFRHARLILVRLLHSATDVLTHVRALHYYAHLTMTEQTVWSPETVDLLMHASVLAVGAKLDYEQALIGMTLAQIMLKTEMPQKALQAMSNAMECIYMNGNVYDCARADFTLVRCTMAAELDVTKKPAVFQRALSTLEYAVDSYRKLEVHAKILDIYAYIAQTFHELNDITQRNLYAGKFKQYCMENETSVEFLGMEF